LVNNLSITQSSTIIALAAESAERGVTLKSAGDILPNLMFLLSWAQLTEPKSTVPKKNNCNYFHETVAVSNDYVV
jgi:hypothetical protein